MNWVRYSPALAEYSVRFLSSIDCSPRANWHNLVHGYLVGHNGVLCMRCWLASSRLCIHDGELNNERLNQELRYQLSKVTYTDHSYLIPGPQSAAKPQEWKDVLFTLPFPFPPDNQRTWDQSAYQPSAVTSLVGGGAGGKHRDAKPTSLPSRSRVKSTLTTELHKLHRHASSISVLFLAYEQNS
ncbi:uncharacterized protein BP01DRAFT_30299 [Aspergillus saccharolyticus JOP 1030-1]|uniref:Uncharacterized protein n=1 Tax=Aspergillus saccharolyticus JOP 1030-1 TaxID=1450539 RepID=A0A318ZHF5_9EURO|nr:hypothetical protein BP01DRAFT_30299 [Aspergillus saccharolyticus JOP 1030-1]PYH46375.1 hypothetical protein BP01DRAFT_30299 [Aspergillus saccharolyticus JOP 1030-1]